MSDSITPSAAAAAATQSRPYSQVPHSTLASQAIIESEAGTKPQAGTAAIKQEQKPTPMASSHHARTSSHNYEHDAALFSSFGGGKSGEVGDQEKNHNRKTSFSMEDQKRLRYGNYMMTPKENKGFSEKE